MQLYYFLAIVVSLSFGSLPGSPQSFGRAAAFSASVVCVWWCLCFLSAKMVVRLIDDGEIVVDLGDSWFYRQTLFLRWFSIALIFLCLGGFGLGRNFSELFVVRDSLFIQSMILLSPATLMMTGVWAAEYVYETRIGARRMSIPDALRFVVNELRCGIGWLLIPILGCMAVLDLVSWVHRVGPVSDQPIGWHVWLIVLAAIVIAIPNLVRRIFPTRRLDQSTSDWVDAILKASGLPSCRIAVWETNDRVFNALIAGLFGRYRVLLLSDRLVNELPRTELAMVILHEVAHAKRFHVPLRIAALAPAWMLGAVSAWAFAQSAAAGIGPTSMKDWSATLGGLISIAAMIVVLRWVSYAIEYDADAAACRLASEAADHCDEVPTTPDGARHALASALRRVTIDSETESKASWLHPAISDRIDRLLPPDEDAVPGRRLFA